MNERKKYRILFVMTPAFDPFAGGVQRTTYKLGKQFTLLKHEIAYFSTSCFGNRTPDYGKGFFAPTTGGPDNQVNIDALESCIRDFKPDYVINQMPPEKGLRDSLSRFKVLYNFKLIGCLRNSLFKVKDATRQTAKDALPSLVFRMFNNKLGLKLLFHLWKGKFAKRLRSIIDKHDKYVLLVPPNLEELKYYVGNYKLNKVRIISNSIPEVLKELPVGEKIILHVGRIEVTQKRSDLLIPFWERVKDELPDWKFIIIGDGSYKAVLDEEIAKRGMDRIELLGYQDPSYYFKKAPIFMMPSAFEGFPNTILEAQSYGCASVAYNSYPAVDWIVNNQKDAVLIPPYMVQKMAREVVKLAKSKTDLTNMRISALENAKRFTIDEVCIDWMHLFEEMAK